MGELASVLEEQPFTAGPELQAIQLEWRALQNPPVPKSNGSVHPLNIVLALRSLVDDDTVIATDMGSVHIWMARHFFSGGIMPSDNLFDRFQHDVRIVDRWQLDGAHYQKTSEAWLENLDAHRDEALKLFAEVYGATDALKWLVRWRIFFMACAELWGYRGGSEWIVSHYLFQPAR